MFEPPVPPLTRNISENEKLKLGVGRDKQIFYGLTIIGEAIEKLPYFIYATEIFARNGLGAERTPFALADVWVKDLLNDRYQIFQPEMDHIEPHGEFVLNLKDLFLQRFDNFEFNGSGLKMKFLIPMRILRNGKLLTKLTFLEIFKQSSLRLKLLFDTYGEPLEYDYQLLLKKADRIRIAEQNIWRHNSERWTNRQNRKLYLDGMLGEIKFVGNDLADLLPILLLGEILHIGSASSFGFGKYRILD